MSDTEPFSLPWLCETDSSIGNATDEYEFLSYDVTTAPASDEAIIDPGEHYEPTFDTTYTDYMVKLIIYVISHSSWATSPPGNVLPIRLRTIPINTPPVPMRVKKKAASNG